LKLVERLGEVPRPLQLVALLENIAGRGPLSVVHLRTRNGAADNRGGTDQHQKGKGSHACQMDQ
jgi:hypothetical protein